MVTLYLTKCPTNVGNIIRLWYSAPLVGVAITADLPEGVDVESLLWGACAHLWRWYISNQRRDNPTALDLMNEAKQSVKDAERRMAAKPTVTMGRDPHYSRY